MGAPRRVSGEQVRAAVEATQGNLASAAAVVGIARHNLRARLEDAGVGPAQLARIRAQAQGSTRTLRVGAAVFERLREAKFDLQAKLRTDLDEVDVLRLFVEDRFESWLGEKVRP